jgi:ribose 5-phosphate isomerase B
MTENSTEHLTLLNHTFAIAADHGGFALKQHLLDYFSTKNIAPVLDLGVYNTDKADFPNVATKMVHALETKQATWGILICGTGIGISIAANRHPNIYAALCHDVTTARLARQHNNANILALGGRILGPSLAEEIVEAFRETPFLEGHYTKRMCMIDQH